MGEVYLIYTAYNLRRLMSIFDFKSLMKKIKDFCPCFLSNQNRFIVQIKIYKAPLTKNSFLATNKNIFFIFDNIKWG